MPAKKGRAGNGAYVQFLVSPNPPHIPPILDGPNLLGDGDGDISIRLRLFNRQILL